MARLVFVAALEGALAGLLAGAVLGVWNVFLHRDVAHRMWFLMAWRVDRWMFDGLLAGAVLSVILALTARGLAASGRPRLARAAVPFVPLLALAGILAFGSSRRWLSLLLRPPGSPEAVTWVSAIPLAVVILALVFVRVREIAAETSGRWARSGPRRDPIVVTGLALVLLAAVVHHTLPQVAARRAAGRPSVVLISIDTLRADRLGASGYHRNLTPALDRLAAQGACFLQATSTAPWTFPAHLSLFTSSLPFDTGERVWRAAPDSVMLAEIFRNEGYRTLAHTGGTWVDARIGFAQGFEKFKSHDEISEGGPAGYLAKAAAWIEHLGGAPFFLFLHTYEPHIPYVHRDYADSSQAGLVGTSFDFEDLGRLRDGSFVPTEQERTYIVDLYDGDVAATDRYVGSFLERLDAACRPEDVIVMVVSDHGEELWDHVPQRSADHGHSLYEEQLRVPWIVRKTGDVAPGVQVRRPVSLLAVAPTALELAGLPRRLGHRGRSLAAYLRDATEPSEVPIFAEMVEYGPDRFSVRYERFKAILTPFPDVVHNDVHLDTEVLEVFDLGRDPLERENLGRPKGPALLAFVTLLQLRAARCLDAAALADSTRIPEALREQMQALGYVQ